MYILIYVLTYIPNIVTRAIPMSLHKHTLNVAVINIFSTSFDGRKELGVYISTCHRRLNKKNTSIHCVWSEARVCVGMECFSLKEPLYSSR